MGIWLVWATNRVVMYLWALREVRWLYIMRSLVCMPKLADDLPVVVSMWRLGPKGPHHATFGKW